MTNQPNKIDPDDKIKEKLRSLPEEDLILLDALLKEEKKKLHMRKPRYINETLIQTVKDHIK